MPKYEAEFEIPMNMDPEQLYRFVEGLRAFGHPKFVYRVEAANKEEAATETANETWEFPSNAFNPTDFWRENLKPIRGKRAQEDI